MAAEDRRHPHHDSKDETTEGDTLRQKIDLQQDGGQIRSHSGMRKVQPDDHERAEAVGHRAHRAGDFGITAAATEEKCERHGDEQLQRCFGGEALAQRQRKSEDAKR